MAGEGQIQTAAQAMAADGGNRGNREVLDEIHQALAALGEAAGLESPETEYLFDLCTRGKRFRAGGENDALE